MEYRSRTALVEDDWLFGAAGQYGIVLNEEKFQFAQITVYFAGFEITGTRIRPLEKFLNAIRDFPGPTRLTDARSWFSLVNQVTHYDQLTDIMEGLSIHEDVEDDMETYLATNYRWDIEKIMEFSETWNNERSPHVQTCYNDWNWFLRRKMRNVTTTGTVLRSQSQPIILQSLQAAHQGINYHHEWTSQSYNLLARYHERHPDCKERLPLLQQNSPFPSQNPTTSFEAIACDYLQYKGWHYVVAAGRLSGWT